jgi:hypothetical protein
MCGLGELTRRPGDAGRTAFEAAPVAPRPLRTPLLPGQQLHGEQRVERRIEAPIGCRLGGRTERSGQGSRGLDARHPRADRGEGTTGRRQQLQERHQHHGVAPDHRPACTPRVGLRGDRSPDLVDFERWPRDAFVLSAQADPGHRLHRAYMGTRRPRRA